MPVFPVGVDEAGVPITSRRFPVVVEVTAGAAVVVVGALLNPPSKSLDSPCACGADALEEFALGPRFRTRCRVRPPDGGGPDNNPGPEEDEDEELFLLRLREEPPSFLIFGTCWE